VFSHFRIAKFGFRIANLNPELEIRNPQFDIRNSLRPFEGAFTPRVIITDYQNSNEDEHFD